MLELQNVSYQIDQAGMRTREGDQWVHISATNNGNSGADGWILYSGLKKTTNINSPIADNAIRIKLVDSATGSLMAEPSLNTRGFIFVEEHMDLIREAINVVYNTIGKSTSKGALDEASLSRAIKSDMKTFIYNTTKKSPMIIPVILYV